MKRFIIICVSILTWAIAQGQINTFYPFPDSTYWRVDVHCQYSQINCDEYYYYHSYLGGDTIINSVSHNKVMRDSVVLIGVGGPSCLLYPWAAFTGYMGALKQDSLEKKVFLVWPNTYNDTLIYDYNLAVGDTIKGFLANGCNMIIGSVDSILIGIRYRKRWIFNTCNEGPGYIIQGIGSDNGLIEKINNSGFCNLSLICVKNSSTILFLNNVPSLYGCQLIYTEMKEAERKNEIQIYPNPFLYETTLKLNDNLKNVTLTIYNLYGQQMKQINNISGQEFILYRDHLSNGIYFIRLSQYNKIIYSDKIVIVDN